MFKLSNPFAPQPVQAAPVAQQQPNQNTQVVAPQAGAQPASSGSPMIDQSKQGGGAQTVAKETSPLDAYAELWETKTEEAGGGNPTNPKTPATAKDPDFVGYAGKIDFSRVLAKNPELVTKALQGDAGAFGQVLNSVVQAAVAVSLKSSHSMINTRSAKDRESIIGDLPNHFKSFSVAQSGSKNPAFKHPALKPVVDAFKQQFLQKYPDATPQEIEDHTENYMRSSFEAAGFTPKPGSKGAPVLEETSEDPQIAKMQKQERGQFNWMEEYGLEEPKV